LQSRERLKPHEAGVEAFDLDAVGPDDLMPFQHQVDIPGLAQGMVDRDPPIADQIAGAHEDLRLPPQVARRVAADEDAVFGADDKVFVGTVDAERVDPQADGPLIGQREEPCAGHAPMARPDHLPRAVVAREQAIAHIEILDRDFSALGPEARAGREADHRRPVIGRAHRRAVGTGDDRMVAVGRRHAIREQKDLRRALFDGDRHDGVEGSAVGHHEGAGEDGIGVVGNRIAVRLVHRRGGGKVGGARRLAAQQVPHHPRRASPKLFVIPAGGQDEGGAIAFQGKRTAMPAPTHPFRQFWFCFCR
jgi:hypothetical protein